MLVTLATANQNRKGEAYQLIDSIAYPARSCQLTSKSDGIWSITQRSVVIKWDITIRETWKLSFYAWFYVYILTNQNMIIQKQEIHSQQKAQRHVLFWNRWNPEEINSYQKASLQTILKIKRCHKSITCICLALLFIRIRRPFVDGLPLPSTWLVHFPEYLTFTNSRSKHGRLEIV